MPVPVIVYVMRAPRSYTREDVVELHLPGSPAVLDMVMDDLLSDGPPDLRPAGPGEFTRRAFLNGRIDLAQAEAVLGIIRARSEAELLRAAARLQEGADRECRRLLGRVTELRVQVEAALDFAVHDIELVDSAELLHALRDVVRRAEQRLADGRRELASSGAVEVVLCGPPNAGKSSLLNRLTGQEHALVHDRAGTTRDGVAAELTVDGVRLRITDTAGLMAAAGGPDAEAVVRARDRAAAAQMVVLVLDAARPLNDELPEFIGSLPPDRTVCALNKADLPPAVGPRDVRQRGFPGRIVSTSAATGRGVGQLRQVLASAVAEGRVDASAADAALNARARQALRRVLRELRQAAGAVEQGLGYEFAAVNLREAAEALGEITGEAVGGSVGEEVLDGIFARFCIGK